MKRNLGSFEVAARMTAGCGLFIAANHGYSAAAWCGAGLLVCAAVRFCPLWWVLRIDTGRSEKIYRPRWRLDDEN